MKKGFTLIELLIVIAIIGVLSSIVISSLNQSRAKAKLTKIWATMQQINNLVFICVDGGGTLQNPTSAVAGGGVVCSNGSDQFPSLSNTGFQYCGGACGGFQNLNSNSYAFSAYSDAFSGGRKIVVCGMGVNVSGWYYPTSNFNFVGQIKCIKDGF